METALKADVSLVKAWKGDSEGNLIYRKTARNFNPMMATAGAVTVAEVELLVDAGDLCPDHIHTPAYSSIAFSGVCAMRSISSGAPPASVRHRRAL